MSRDVERDTRQPTPVSVALSGEPITSAGPITGPLLNLGILQESNDGPRALPIDEAVDAGWLWREAQAD